MIKPKVNVNPIVNYMTDRKNRDNDPINRNTVTYETCSQIIPTVGLSNLIFYDCNKQSSSEPGTQRNFFTESGLNENQRYVDDEDYTEWMTMSDSRNSFENLMRTVPHTLIDRPPDRDFTETMDISSFDHSFEMDLDSPVFDLNERIDDINEFDNISFELNFTDNQSINHNDDLDENSFEIGLASRNNENITDIPNNATKFDSQFDSPDSNMISDDESQCDDESMAKFAVSKWSDISFDVNDDGDGYNNFVPLDTSTPKPRRKTWSRNDVMSCDIDNFTSDAFAWDQQQRQAYRPRNDFMFSGE